MIINLIYSPYSLFKWCLNNKLIPDNSELVCGHYSKTASAEDDGVHRFVISEKCSDSKQITQAAATIASYRAQLKGTVDIESEVQKILGMYTTSWMLEQMNAAEAVKEKNAKITLLDDSLLHPVAIGLKRLAEMGFLRADVLAYIGEIDIPTGDFCFVGSNTQSQLSCFSRQLKKVFGLEKSAEVLKKTEYSWESLRTEYQDRFGFSLCSYNFQSEAAPNV